MNETDTKLLELSQKKIAVFGLGGGYKNQFVPYGLEELLHPVLYLDNNPTHFLPGKNCCRPQEVDLERREQLCVIIALIREQYYEEAVSQLNELGFRHFIQLRYLHRLLSLKQEPYLTFPEKEYLIHIDVDLSDEYCQWIKDVAEKVPEKIYCGENLFFRSRQLLKKYRFIQALPVYDDAEKIVATVTFSHVEPIQTMQFASILQFATAGDGFSIPGFFPEIKRYLFIGVNELTWKLYLYLKACGCNCILFGREWTFLKETPEEEMPDIQEGDRVISAWDHISDSLGWLYEYAGKCIDRQILAIRKQLKNADVAVLDFNFPTICEMYPLTEDEQYNINHHITGDWIFSYKYDDEEQKQFYKLYGRDFQTLSKELPYYDRTREGIFQTCPTYKSENSENPLHVYLFGPCISIQTDLPEENKLIHLLQEHLNRDFPGKYSVESIRIQVERFPFYSEVFQRMKLMAGDVVIFLSDSNDFGRGAVSLKSFFVQERKGGTLVFSNAPIHILPHMSEKLAEHIYSTYLKKQILSSIVKNADRIALFPEHLEDNQVEAIQKYVAAYTDQICEDGGGYRCHCNEL